MPQVNADLSEALSIPTVNKPIRLISLLEGVAELRDEQISGSQAGYSPLKIPHPVNQQRQSFNIVSKDRGH